MNMSLSWRKQENSNKYFHGFGTIFTCSHFLQHSNTYKQSNAVLITGLLCVVLSSGFSKLLFLYFGIFRKCAVFMALDSSKE